MRRHRLSFCWATALMAAAGSLFAGSPVVVGDWEGALNTGNGSLRVVFHISQAKDESFTGTMDSPGQGVTGVVITSASYDEPVLRLEIERVKGIFAGKMNKDNSEITGEWKQGSASLPLTLKKVVK